MNQTFPKSHRLLKRHQYQQTSLRAERVQGSLLFLEIAANSLPLTRVGIAVTRKFGNACKRNRFKRIVREAFRTCYSKLPSGFDVIVRPRKGILEVKSDQIQEDLLKLLKK